MAVMADFARRPTKEKAMIFAIIGALLGLLYWQFVYKALNRDIAEADADHQSKLATNRRLEQEIPKFEALKARMTQLKSIIDENQKALPTEAELPAFFETLNRKVLEAGVEVHKWRQMPESPIEAFVRVPVDIELTGTYMEIKKFFASLVPKKKKPGEPTHTTDDAGVEERERIVSVENLELKNPTVKNREIVLTATFTATTYRQDERAADPTKPVAKPTPTTRPTPKPSTGATGAAGSAAPLPSAATPRGAKARVEQSIDKGDNRDRDATGVDEAKTPSGSAGRLKGGL